VQGSLQQLLAAFDASLPLERAKTLPSSWYRSPELAELERRAVFGESWHLVARADQLAGSGSFVTATVAGEPILLVRDEQGTLRGFFNVCRHRAACVVTEPQGTATRLRCRYHGWTYDLAGRLRGTPEFDGVADFLKEEQGLVPISVDIWGPLVFVHTGERPPPLRDALAPLPQRIGALAGLTFLERREYPMACNWKVFVDNYLDGGYHVNTVHPTLAGVLQYSEYRTECFPTTSLQSSPLRAADDSGRMASAATVRSGSRASYGWAFPGFMINAYAGVMDTNVVFPEGPERCRVVIDFYFSALDSAEDRRRAAESVALGHAIQLEDVGVCEDVQRGLGSRSYEAGRFSFRREEAVLRFHQLLAARLRSAAG